MDITITSPISHITEILNRMRRTNNKELREHYAKKARALLTIAERSTSRSDPEAQAGLRRARVELEQIVDYQFPEISRKDELDNLNKLAGSANEKLEACNLGVFNTTNVIKGCSWITLLGVGTLLYLLGRAHRKKVARRKARARARARRKRQRA
jgi:hypothetical protein